MRNDDVNAHDENCEGEGAEASAGAGESTGPLEVATVDSAVATPKLATEPDCQDDVEKTYSLILIAEVKVAIQVNAKTANEAIGKAFTWDGDYPQGWCKVGDYYCCDDEDYMHCRHDTGEMIWEIIAVDPQDTEDVEELEDADADECVESPTELEP